MISKLARRKWPTRLIILGIILSVVMLIGVTILTHLTYQTAEVNILIDHDRQVTFLSASRLETELSKFSQVLSTLARKKEILSQDPVVQQQALHDEGYRLADFDGGVVLLDNYGKVVTSEPVQVGIIGQDWSDRDYFGELLRTSNNVYSNSVVDGTEQEPVVVICVPILNDEGHFSGALAGMFRLGQKTVSPFYASIVRLRLGDNGNSYVVDGNGIVLFDSATDQAGLPYADHVAGIPLGESSGATRTTDSNQKDIVVTYAQIPGTPWTLITEESWGVLTANLQRYVNLLLGLMILAILIPSAGLGLILHLRSTEIASFSYAEHEMRITRQIKQKVLPDHIPVLPGWNLSVYHHDGQEPSSDYYDYQYLQDGRLMLAAASIDESGIPGMLNITNLRSSLHGAAQRLLSPGEALDFSNALLCPEMNSQFTMNCVYAIFDPARRTFEYASAGTSLAYFLNGSEVNELSSTGPPVGFTLDMHYQQHREVFETEERFLICTDGVVNLRNQKGEAFGKQRLVEILCEPGGSDLPVAERLVAELKAFCNGKLAPEDDLCILVLEPTPEW